MKILNIFKKRNITSKYKDMLESFECDFSLAEENIRPLAELDTKIKEHNKRLIKDINLLKELSYLLRYGKAKIVISGE